MRNLKKLNLVALMGLMACSTVPKKDFHTAEVPAPYVGRYVANMNEVLNDPKVLESRVQKLMSGIFHGYILAQVHLQNFDSQLDKDAASAMKGDDYATLLSIRSFVDHFEHDINDLYMELVLATAMPGYSPEQKQNAQVALDTIGKFMDGVKSDQKELPENLKPLILSNLREKQTVLYEQLKALHDAPPAADEDPQMKKVIYDNMVLLRATRRSYYRELQNYQVDQVALKETLKQEKSKKSFKEFEKEIKSVSKEMKKFIKDISRGTSADAIYPSAGPNGNVTGRSWPQNTWSLTYDDGPAKTTDQVITNLVDKKIPATFFMLAQQAVQYPKAIARMKENNMDLASHSYTHAQLTKLGPVGLEKEITTAKKVTEEKIGQPIKLFRLPYGAGVSVSSIRSKIAENNMIHVFWTVDTLDWQDKNPQSILARALKQMNGTAKNSGIILFHDIHPQSVAASSLLMDHFNKTGLITCSVQGVVDQLNKSLASCK